MWDEIQIQKNYKGTLAKKGFQELKVHNGNEQVCENLTNSASQATQR